MVGSERIELSFLGLKDRCFTVKLRADKLELRGGTDPPLRLYQSRVLPLYEQSLEPTVCAAHTLQRYELCGLLLSDFGLNLVDSLSESPEHTAPSLT
jgi:hypothetical protein